MRIVLALLAALLVVACSGVEIKPGEGSHARREIPPGPGLLSGSDGEFVIFRSGASPVEDGATEEEAGPEDQAVP